MSATQSSSSASSSHASPSSSPEAPKKTPKSPVGSPEAPGTVRKPSQGSPETPKKGHKSPPDSPEVPRAQKALPDSTEVPRAQRRPSDSTEVPRAQKALPDSTEVPRAQKALPDSTKVPRAQRRPSDSTEVPRAQKALPDSTKVPRAQRRPSDSTEVPRAQKALPDSTEVPRAQKALPDSTEVPRAQRRPSDSTEVPRAQKALPGSTEVPEVQEAPPGDHEAPKITPKVSQLSKGRLDNTKFKSSLQVLLQHKQEGELVKSKEYKDKIDKEDDEEDDGGNEERREGRRGSEDGRIDQEDTEKEFMPPPLPPKTGKGSKERELAKIKKATKEEDGTCEAGEGRAEAQGRSEGRKETERERKTKPEKQKEKIKVMENIEAKNNEKYKKVTEKTKEKSMENKIETKEEKKQMAKIVEKAKEEKKKCETKKEEKKRGEEKREEKAKESTKKRKMQVDEKERTTKEETREENAGKEEKRRKKEGGKEEDRKKKKEERAHGFLYLKRKRTFSPWKEYYFILDGLLLTYYRSQHEHQGLGIMKGSLDMSLVEEVKPKKPGIIKSHQPFCLPRRNLPSIHLAAETKEEQERWMSVLEAVITPRRYSCHSSDKTLNAGTTPKPDPNVNKSATLPARVNDSSSSSDNEEEEEPEMIKPRKIARMPIIGMPLAMIDLDQVKLKKVEKKEVEKKAVKREDGQEAKADDVPPSTGEDQTQEDAAREVSPSERFGVVLKKATKEEKESPAETGGPRDGSTSPGHATTSVRRPSKQPVIPLNSRKLLVVPGVKEDKSPRVSPTTQKRSTSDRKKSPSPSLPISKSVQSLTKSAEELKTTKIDHVSAADSTTTTSADVKSKGEGVKLSHAHTFELKYDDVVDIMHDEEKVMSSMIKTGEEDVMTGISEASENKGTVARREEMLVQKSKGDLEHSKETLENEKLIKEDEEQKPHQEEDVKQVDEDDGEDQDENKEVVCVAPKDGAKEMPDVKTLAEDSVNKSQERETAAGEHKQVESSAVEGKNGETEVPDPDFFPKSCSVGAPPTPPASPASSMTSSDSEAITKTSLSSSSGSNLVPSSPKPGPSSSAHPPPSPGALGDSRNLEEIHSSVQTEKRNTEEGEVAEVPSGASRARTNTNESTASSCCEGSEKKPGKFEMLKNKFKVGGSMKDKKEDPAVQKDPKEKKRRGSNSFSILLQGKKTKEGSKKPAEEELRRVEEPQPSQQEDKDGPDTAPHHDNILTTEKPPTESKASEEPPTESKASEEPPTESKALRDVVATVDVEVTPPSAIQSSSKEEDLQASLDTFLDSLGMADNGMVTLRTSATCSEMRTSTYSHTSTGSHGDPPPSIPEKTYTRAKSPIHDVPMNNKPVTNLPVVAPDREDEDETNLKVDGYMSEKQIDALLNANENREKRKRSKSRSQIYAQPDVLHVKAAPSVSMPTEAWAIKRPSCTSISSMDSDDPLPTTNFLSLERQLSSSGSIRASAWADGSQSAGSSFSDGGEPTTPEMEVPVEFLRRAPRATDAITTKNRVSLTSPEFTVKEEEGLSSPETPKARPTQVGGYEDKEQRGGEDESEDEHKDFFPGSGGDVQLRPPVSLDLPTGALRTSGIASLKEFLEAQQDDGGLGDVKPGISRLGHSAAVEKLKQTTGDP